MLKKPKEYTVVDNIFEIQQKELLDKISTESVLKLKKLNKNIEERCLKGADIIQSKKLDPFEENEEK